MSNRTTTIDTTTTQEAEGLLRQADRGYCSCHENSASCGYHLPNNVSDPWNRAYHAYIISVPGGDAYGDADQGASDFADSFTGGQRPSVEEWPTY